MPGTAPQARTAGWPLTAGRASPDARTAAATLPWLVIGLFVGAWVDRLPARPLMIICDLVSLVLYASLPVAYWLGVLTFVQVLVVALLAGGCGVVFLTAYYVSGSSPLTVTCGGWPSLRRSTISGCLATWP
jgi:hypothetical protein